MHFRIGDYKKYSNIHPILDINYYKKCIKDLNQDNLTCLVFNEIENQDEVKNKLKHIKNVEFIFCNDKYKKTEDYEEMILMSLFEVNIIANSTFSWWAAYLNQNEKKKVYYPKTWINVPHELKFPKEWKCID